jgi:hypothetical protein
MANHRLVALDVIALMDALQIQRATIGAFDIGARSPISSLPCGPNGARQWCR